MAHKYLGLSTVLKKLLFDHNLKPADLARALHIPPPTIHRLITGKSTRPYKSSLQPIADYFSISIDALLGEETLEPNTTSQLIHHIPLFTWEQIATATPHAIEHIPYIGNISTKSFATSMQDSSMEPVFSQGNVLIFDPEKKLKDRSYVLVKLSDNNLIVFRQLIIDLDQHYIKPLNPDLTSSKIRAITEHDRIIGVLVEARKIYNET